VNVQAENDSKIIPCLCFLVPSQLPCKTNFFLALNFSLSSSFQGFVSNQVKVVVVEWGVAGEVKCQQLDTFCSMDG